MNNQTLFTADTEKEIIEFAQDLIRQKSLSGQEGDIANLIKNKMLALDYDDATVDSMGNVLGRIGHGEKSIMFDSHMDAVDVNDEDNWDYPPYCGKIINGCLYGRGSVDMKSAIAATIYAGAIAKRKEWDSGKTIYVSCSVSEEDCDGENLKSLFQELNLKPNYVVICEPSNNNIALGHKGKAQLTIKTFGVSAHGSAPEMGKNAIYEMADIIKRVEATNDRLSQQSIRSGTLVMSRIMSTSVSLNAIPSECEVYLDRRLVPGETEDTIRQEMDHIIEGKKAIWEVGTLHRTSWTGMKFTYVPYHLAWSIDEDHELTRTCNIAYQEYFGMAPAEYIFWDYSTNAVASVGLGIPTIGFGPGDNKLAHMINEFCNIDQIIDACGFYIHLIQRI